jgi:FtsZ-binding cell division protein ZapB
LQNKTDYLEEMNTQLTQQVQSLSDERDILRTVLGEVREQNYSFSKEINLLKVELNRMINNQGSCVH